MTISHEIRNLAVTRGGGLPVRSGRRVATLATMTMTMTMTIAASLTFGTCEQALAQAAVPPPRVLSDNAVPDMQILAVPATSLRPWRRGGGEAPAGQRPPSLVLKPSAPRSAVRAFEDEMRDQTLRSRALGNYGLIAMHMPEMIEDDLSERRSARAAEHILTSSAGSALREAFGWGSDGPKRTAHRGLAKVEHGLRLGSGPEWVVRRRGEGADFRVSVPLLPGAVRMRAWFDVPGQGPSPRRFGTSLSLNAFTQSVTCGFSFQF